MVDQTITPYPETDCLLAVLEGRDADAERVVDEMTMCERNEFAKDLRKVLVIVEAA